MAVETDPRIGTTIAGYEIERLLGRGGMSAVYLAYDPGLDRRVALKLMSPELSEDEGFRERFRAEWRLAASIDHPNVIPIYEAGDFDGTLFIAMRYVEGTDLKELLEEEGALEPQRALNLVSQAAKGLDAAHERGLVHRDVKPSNLARDGKEEHAYLADFGLTKPASTADEARESIQLSGTTDYVSPEQIEHGTAEARSDIYALGALIFETLTGHVPYPRDRPIAVLWAHLNDPPPRASEIRPELPVVINGVIAKAMAKEPEARYASGGDLADAAGAAFPEPKRPRWQVAAAIGVLAAAIAAAVTLAAVLLTGDNGPTEPGGTTAITTNLLQRIDPETDTLSATIELDFVPVDLAAGEAGVWLLSQGDKMLSRIDTDTNTVVDSVPIEVDLPVDVASNWIPWTIEVEDEAVWTSLASPLFQDFGGAVWAYDRRTDPSLRLRPLTLEFPATSPSVAATSGFLSWNWSCPIAKSGSCVSRRTRRDRRRRYSSRPTQLGRSPTLAAASRWRPMTKAFGSLRRTFQPGALSRHP